MKLVYTN